MVIQTSRFGSIEVNSEDTIEFPEGLIGFGQLKKYVLLDDPNDDLFAWLQSCDNPNIAFPVLEPELFLGHYNIELARHELQALEMSDMERARVFTIVTIPDDPTQMTANIKAPLVINVPQRIARQCVLQDSKLAIREPIFAKLQQRVVANPGQSIRSQAESVDVTVRIPSRERDHQPEIP